MSETIMYTLSTVTFTYHSYITRSVAVERGWVGRNVNL